jgi:hypothetical protein
MAVQITKTEFKNYGKCIKLSNDVCELIITTDVGPRVISFCMNGKENIFFEDIDRKILWQGDVMDNYYGKGSVSYLYGGHRLWVAEELVPNTTYPDTTPVDVEYTPNGVILKSNPETENGFQKIVRIELDENEAKVKVAHDVINISDKPQKFAPWALSVLAPGGVEIVPQPQRDTGLLSNRKLILWPYTNMSDDRVMWGKEFITLKQDENADVALKFGFNSEEGYASYLNRGQIFTKRFDHDRNAEYPDFGCSFETYTNLLFMEMEGLGRFEEVEPNKSILLIENWELKNCDTTFDRKDEKSVKEFVEQYIK